MSLFVAACVPDALKETLGAYAAEVASTAPEGRLVPSANWHLTMAFLGQDASDEAIGRAKAALERLEAKDFLFDVKGISYFPTSRPDRCVVWARVEDVGELRRCHARLKEALEREGFALGHAEFRPHVTLARNVTRMHAAELTERELYAAPHGAGASELKLLRTVRAAEGGVAYEELAARALETPKDR